LNFNKAYDLYWKLRKIDISWRKSSCHIYCTFSERRSGS